MEALLQPSDGVKYITPSPPSIKKLHAGHLAVCKINAFWKCPWQTNSRSRNVATFSKREPALEMLHCTILKARPGSRKAEFALKGEHSDNKIGLRPANKYADVHGDARLSRDDWWIADVEGDGSDSELWWPRDYKPATRMTHQWHQQQQVLRGKTKHYLRVTER